MVDPLKWLGLGERICRLLISPIKAEVTCLSYINIVNLHDSGVVVLSPYPWSYRATVELTNRGDDVVYIKRVVLRVGGAEYVWSEAKPLRLGPREPTTARILFPVSHDAVPAEEGEFMIEITPSVGRATKLKGWMPISEKT